MSAMAPQLMGLIQQAQQLYPAAKLKLRHGQATVGGAQPPGAQCDIFDGRTIRTIRVEVGTGLAGVPELVVVDGPLRQPLVDYVGGRQESEAWQTPVIQSALHVLPEKRRVSFEEVFPETRSQAMEVACAEAEARERHAQEQLSTSFSISASQSAMNTSAMNVSTASVPAGLTRSASTPQYSSIAPLLSGVPSPGPPLRGILTPTQPPPSLPKRDVSPHAAPSPPGSVAFTFRGLMPVRPSSVSRSPPRVRGSLSPTIPGAGVALGLAASMHVPPGSLTAPVPSGPVIRPPPPAVLMEGSRNSFGSFNASQRQTGLATPSRARTPQLLTRSQSAKSVERDATPPVHFGQRRLSPQGPRGKEGVRDSSPLLVDERRLHPVGEGEPSVSLIAGPPAWQGSFDLNAAAPAVAPAATPTVPQGGPRVAASPPPAVRQLVRTVSRGSGGPGPALAAPINSTVSTITGMYTIGGSSPSSGAATRPLSPVASQPKVGPSGYPTSLSLPAQRPGIVFTPPGATPTTSGKTSPIASRTPPAVVRPLVQAPRWQGPALPSSAEGTGRSSVGSSRRRGSPIFFTATSHASASSTSLRPGRTSPGRLLSTPSQSRRDPPGASSFVGGGPDARSVPFTVLASRPSSGPSEASATSGIRGASVTPPSGPQILQAAATGMRAGPAASFPRQMSSLSASAPISQSREVVRLSDSVPSSASSRPVTIRTNGEPVAAMAIASPAHQVRRLVSMPALTGSQRSLPRATTDDDKAPSLTHGHQATSGSIAGVGGQSADIAAGMPTSHPAAVQVAAPQAPANGTTVKRAAYLQELQGSFNHLQSEVRTLYQHLETVHCESAREAVEKEGRAAALVEQLKAVRQVIDEARAKKAADQPRQSLSRTHVVARGT
eukprot:TRINITY_DN120768_c0_g1_i1.p1 TRINITY_DN120768_c0_g1~~TRINITY_DN120768_c0_g1_i1.p1  ORF type:complete len:890 (+),score=91.76 TRINITY_DN120768_c0_g1_i1:155-2824(+)